MCSIEDGPYGNLVWSESCGFADRGRRRKVTRSTQFRVGSVSKTLTAATVARLSERGLIEVDAPIRDYVAAYQGSGPAPTLRQLGGHLGGIRHYEGAEAINSNRNLLDRINEFDAVVATTGLSARVVMFTQGDFRGWLREAHLEDLGGAA